jgi:hypothetical protein
MLLVPVLAGADQQPRITQQVDHDEIGLQDTFTLTVLVEDPPSDAEIEFPSSPDFEVISRFQSSQRSMQFGGGQTGFKTTEHYTLVMRPHRTGHLVLPASKLRFPGGTLKTAPISLTVHNGTTHSVPPQQAQRRRSMNPFAGFPGFDDQHDPFDDFFSLPDERIPTSNSDLFLKAYLDKSEAYVGEQVNYSVYIFSQVQLSSVENLVLPKMDGFWAEDVDSPTQLAGEPKQLDGVNYTAFLVKRRALFPDRAGNLEIPPASAEITAGNIIAGRQFHRDSNKLKLTVKNAPPGAPADFRAEQVGDWKLSADAQPTQVELGQPITVRVALEGKGNLKRMSMPRLPVVSGLKAYEPTTSDTATSHGGRVGGRRVQEYLVMPQRTGSFTVPPLKFSFFNPKSGHYQTAETPSIALTVTPSTGVAESGPSAQNPIAKNVLAPGALHPLRAVAQLGQSEKAPWQQPWFFGLTLFPVGLWGFVAVSSRLRARTVTLDPSQVQKKKARLAKERLAQAHKLIKGPPDPFYLEVERAVLSALELKVGGPVSGLAHAELMKQMDQAGYPPAQRENVLKLLEACETARYAPGLASASRAQILESAESVLSGGAA